MKSAATSLAVFWAALACACSSSKGTDTGQDAAADVSARDATDATDARHAADVSAPDAKADARRADAGAVCAAAL